MAKVVGYDQSAYKRTTCHECAAIIEYTAKDLEEKTETDYTGSRDLVYILRCPGCGHGIRFNTKY